MLAAGLLLALGGGGEGQLGARDGVGVEGGVEVEVDALVVRGVQGGSQGALGLLGAAAGDLEIDALGVVLGAVGVPGRVEGDDLVAQDVVSGLQVGRDLDLVAEVVAEDLVGGPGAWGGAGDEALLLDLDELERGLVHGGRVVRRCKVVNNRAVVRLGPGVPGSSDRAASSDGGVVEHTVLGALVADDVGVRVGAGGDEAVVRRGGGPGNEVVQLRGVGLVLLVEALVVNAADVPGGNVSVGLDHADASGDGEDGCCDVGVHLDGVCVVKFGTGLKKLGFW